MRKPLFAVDVTEDRKKETLNAEDFIAKTNAETTVETVEDRSEALEKEIKAFKPPLYLTVIKWAALLAGVILFGVLTRDEAAANNPFGERPIITFFILLSIVVFALIGIYERKKARDMLTDGRIRDAIDETRNAATAALDALGVPTYAYEIDVILFKYKVKNGDVKPITTGLMPTPYVNVWMKVFRNEEHLSLADVESRYDIPLSEFTRITSVTKKIALTSWNKDCSIKDERYAPYKVALLSNDTVSVKGYSIVEFTHGGEDYGIYVPSYDVSAFEFLLGMKAQSDTEETKSENE